jgi:hydroxymethylpyrimidine kinase/phosphomethylpyrimidine kinase
MVSAITAITAQDTVGVTAVHPVPSDVVVAQIEAVARDIGVDAAKTGMLLSAAIVKAVAAAIEAWRIPFVVVDPVMIAKSGARLLQEDAVSAIRTKLLPRAYVVTPNRVEAEVPFLEGTGVTPGVTCDLVTERSCASNRRGKGAPSPNRHITHHQITRCRAVIL